MLVVASFAFNGCGGGAPSEVDTKTANDHQIEHEASNMEKMAGSGAAGMIASFTQQIKSIKKIGCTHDGEKASRCDVEVTIASQTQRL